MAALDAALWRGNLSAAAAAARQIADHHARLTLQQGCLHCHEGFRARVAPMLR